MNLAVAFLLVSVGCVSSWEANATDCDNSSLARHSNEVHSRQKRYLIFPKGTSLQLVYCNTYLFRPVVDIFRFGTTAGLAWMLPYEAGAFTDKKRHRIFRRSVFQKLGALIHTRGTNGNDCILRALCESGQRTSTKKSFARELMHRIFSMDDDDDEEDNHEDRVYRRAHRSVNRNCEELYPGCSFSLFDYV